MSVNFSTIKAQETTSTHPLKAAATSGIYDQKNFRARLERLKEAQKSLNLKVSERVMGGRTEVQKPPLKRKLDDKEENSSKIRKIEEDEEEKKQKELIAQFYDAMNQDVDNFLAEMLSEKLEKLPPCPSKKDIDPLLKGLTAVVLQKAEKLIGREMRRVEPIWWALVHRDFGGLDGRRWYCGVRDIYKGYEALHAARKQKQCS